MRNAAWTGVQVVAAFAWVCWITWCLGTFPVLTAIVLGLVPQMVLAGGFFVWLYVGAWLQRRKLLEQEFREP